MSFSQQLLCTSFCIVLHRESVISGDHSGSSSSSRPVNPDSYPNPSQPEPPPPPPPPPLRIPTMHYGTRRHLSLGHSPSTAPATTSTTPSSVARPVSPDQESRISDAQDYAAAVTLSALGLRRVSSRQYRAQRENDANRMRSRRHVLSFEEARYSHNRPGANSGNGIGSADPESEGSSTIAGEPAAAQESNVNPNLPRSAILDPASRLDR